MNVPDSVAMIIRAVYLEKTHTMKKMRKDHELACIGFRKWVIEQKKKTKKDPLPLARIEVSKVRSYFIVYSVEGTIASILPRQFKTNLQ